MAYIRSLYADLKEGKLEIDIDFYDEPKKTETVYARILEVLKDAGIQGAKVIFERRFGEEMGAKTAREITKHHLEKIREANKIENSDEYRAVIEKIKEEAQRGYFRAMHHFYIGHARRFHDVGKALESKGFKYNIEPGFNREKLVLLVSWEPEETEDEKHAE